MELQQKNRAPLIRYQIVGHKGPALRPRRIGITGARTQLLIYSNPNFDEFTLLICSKHLIIHPPDGATARGGPWPPLQYASRSLGSLLYLSTRLYPSFSGPWTRHPAISFLVFLFVLLHYQLSPSSSLAATWSELSMCQMSGP